MDFIEQLFGISPDGGDGSTELMFITVLVLIVLLTASRRAIWTFLGRTLGR